MVTAWRQPRPAKVWQCRGNRPLLSPQRKRVVLHLALGLRYQDVAARMGITYSTVQTYAQAAFNTLGVRDATHAVTRALLLGEITLDELREIDEQDAMD